jgi:hypothetical protein
MLAVVVVLAAAAVAVGRLCFSRGVEAWVERKCGPCVGVARAAAGRDGGTAEEEGGDGADGDGPNRARRDKRRWVVNDYMHCKSFPLNIRFLEIVLGIFGMHGKCIRLFGMHGKCILWRRGHAKRNEDFICTPRNSVRSFILRYARWMPWPPQHCRVKCTVRRCRSWRGMLFCERPVIRAVWHVRGSESTALSVLGGHADRCTLVSAELLSRQLVP